jgi:hypothetical protein
MCRRVQRWSEKPVVMEREQQLAEAAVSDKAEVRVCSVVYGDDGEKEENQERTGRTTWECSRSVHYPSQKLKERIDHSVPSSVMVVHDLLIRIRRQANIGSYQVLTI